jgi:hypothetical protein
VDLKIIWDIVKKDWPALKKDIEKIIRENYWNLYFFIFKSSSSVIIIHSIE